MPSIHYDKNNFRYKSFLPSYNHIALLNNLSCNHNKLILRLHLPYLHLHLQNLHRCPPYLQLDLFHSLYLKLHPSSAEQPLDRESELQTA